MKNIVVLSDGTGNAASSIWRTNVWRLYQSLEVSAAQICRYDDGIGSSRLKPFALLTGAVGYGFKRNLIDLYKFVCRNYEPGDRLYAFGFSRGSFTVRALMLLILQQGLVQYGSERELDARAHQAYEAFRTQSFRSIIPIEPMLRTIRDFMRRIANCTSYSKIEKTEVNSIEFIGVWDTVVAYGLPIDEMTRGISKWLFPMGFRERALHPKVVRACQALALDDERTTFHPLLWSEEFEAPATPDNGGRLWTKDERVTQVWFSGAHANVGGGYPDDSLASIPLSWLMMEAAQSGLIFKRFPKNEPDAFRSVSSSCNTDGRLYDSRSGLGAYYRYGPRKIAELCRAQYSRDGRDRVIVRWPKIHESVFQRLTGNASAYAPIGIPANYSVVTGDGEILRGRANPFETPAMARLRAREQEKIWNYVWLRKLFYYATLGATFHLVFFWLFYDRNRGDEFTTRLRPVSELIRAIESFLPDMAHWWGDWYAANPLPVSIGVIALIVCLKTSARLRSTIQDRMRLIWIKSAQNQQRSSILATVLYRARTSRPYLAIVQSLRLDLLPSLGVFAVLAIFWQLLLPATHFVTNIADSSGAFCSGTPPDKAVPVDKGIPQDAIGDFQTSSVCWASGLLVRSGFKYEVTIIMIEPWLDGETATTPVGYQISTGRFKYTNRMMLPLRRVLFRPWFRLIGRVGLTGTDEYFLDPVPAPNTDPPVYKARFTADRNGEIFLYVNDALIPLPVLSHVFYLNNRGTARITARLL